MFKHSLETLPKEKRTQGLSVLTKETVKKSYHKLISTKLSFKISNKLQPSFKLANIAIVKTID